MATVYCNHRELGTHKGGFSTFRFDLTPAMKAEGNTVAAGGAAAEEHTNILIDVKEPHLWDGMADPYCYTAEASIVKDDVILDTVTVTYGYRSFHVDPNTGF